MAIPRIQLLGEISVGVARAQAEIPAAEIGVSATSRLWSEQVQRLTAGVAPAPWYEMPFTMLAYRGTPRFGASPEFEFASRLAAYLRTLPTGVELEDSALSLLDVYTYAPPDLRPDIATQSLRLIEASADGVAATPGGRAMLGRDPVPDALALLRLDDDLQERVSRTAFTLTRAAAQRGSRATPLRIKLDVQEERVRGETFVNVGVDELTAPGGGPSLQRVDPGSKVWVWVELGPRNADAAAGDTEPVDPVALVDGQELEVVVFADVALGATPDAGRVRVVSSGAFPVVRRATATLGDAALDDRLLATRLYFHVELPAEPAAARVRVAIYLRGVLVHVEQLTLPVGLEAPPAVRTMHRLTRTFQAEDRFASLTAPTLSIYANAGDGTHDFSFYLPGASDPAPGIPHQLHLDSTEVLSAIDTARDRLRVIAWGDTDEHDTQPSKFPIDASRRFGNPQRTTRALIDLAVEGHGLWGYLSTELDRNPGFRARLQAAMAPPGAVQLSTKEHPSQILPLQLLYDRNLNTASPSYLKLCSATAAWLEQPEGDPPCLTTACPDASSYLHVCLAGFWGIRHGVSINPAYRTGELRSDVESAEKPVATLATTTDPAIGEYWTPHEISLKKLVNVPSKRAVTAQPIFTSLKDDKSVLLYVLAHVDCEPAQPRIVMSAGPDGAINWSTLNALNPALGEHRPVVFINACASAAMSPDRLLSLIDAFFLHGAGGAVGTEISVFVDFAAMFAEDAVKHYADGDTLAQSLRQARIEGLRKMNPMGFAYIGFGLHDLRLVKVNAT